MSPRNVAHFMAPDFLNSGGSADSLENAFRLHPELWEGPTVCLLED